MFSSQINNKKVMQYQSVEKINKFKKKKDSIPK